MTCRVSRRNFLAYLSAPAVAQPWLHPGEHTVMGGTRTSPGASEDTGSRTRHGSATGPAGYDAATVLALAERRRAELLVILSDLISAASPLGSSAGEAQQVAARYLEKAGYLVERSTDDPDAYARHPEYMPPPSSTEQPVNLVARPSHVPLARLTLFAHIDTQPPAEGWSASPLKPIIRDGRIYGLGAADDKGGVAAGLVAAAALAEMGGPAPIVMSLHGKGGGARGSLPVFARSRDLQAALYIHPAETGLGMTEIKHVSRGVLDLTLTVEGWRGRQREIGTPESVPFAEGGDALDACLTVIRQLREKILNDCEVNLGRIMAGDRPGTVPDRCRAELRVLFSGTRTADDIVESLNRELIIAAQTLAKPSGRFRFSMEPTGMRTNPVSVAWDAPLCRVLRESVAAVTGVEPVSYTGHLASDIRFPIRLCGIPAVGIGSRAGNFYSADEWVDIDDLVRLVAVIMLTVSTWQGSGGRPAEWDVPHASNGDHSQSRTRCYAWPSGSVQREALLA